MTLTTTRTCATVTQHCMDADDEPTRTTCFACGLPACTDCTTVLPRYHRWRNKRVCVSCLSQQGYGDIAARVIWERAGHTDTPPDWLLREHRWDPTVPLRTWSVAVR